MKRITVAALLLLLSAAPAFARHKKPHKDSRVGVHPKAYHAPNEQMRHRVKHKLPKHTA